MWEVLLWEALLWEARPRGEGALMEAPSRRGAAPTGAVLPQGQCFPRGSAPPRAVLPQGRCFPKGGAPTKVGALSRGRPCGRHPVRGTPVGGTLVGGAPVGGAPPRRRGFDGGTFAARRRSHKAPLPQGSASPRAVLPQGSASKECSPTGEGSVKKASQAARRERGTVDGRD